MNLIKKLCAVVALAGVATVASAKMKDQINVGVLATESSTDLKKRYQPFIKDMSKVLGVPVKDFYANDYAGLIQAMRFGKIDVIIFGNKSGIEAVDRAGGEVFAKAVARDGTDGYYSLLITHKDNTKLNSLEDIVKHKKSLVFGNGDPNSTSGWLVPAYYVFAQQPNLDVKDFKRVLNSSHGNNQIAVANKKVDFATNNTENLGRLKANNPEMYSKIKVIWKSPVIPSDPVVWRKELSAETKKALYDFYTTYHESGLPSVKEFSPYGVKGVKFIPGNDMQLLAVRELKTYKDYLGAKKEGDMEKAKKLMAELQEYKRQMMYLDVIANAK